MPRSALTWLLALILVGLVLGVSGCAIAPQKPSLVFSMEGLSVSLYDEPCRNKAVLNSIREESHGAFRAAQVVYQGSPLAACWAAMDGDSVFIVDETGDYGAIPRNRFQRG